MNDLKPCPCCGGTAQLHRVGLYHGIGYRVSCDECLMRTDDAFEPMTAIDTWNNRIPTPNKMCANCKHWEVGYDGLGDCSKSSLGIVYYKESCDKWESI